MLADLPQDVFIHILTLTPFRTCILLRMVCKHFFRSATVTEKLVAKRLGRSESTAQLWLKIDDTDYKLEKYIALANSASFQAEFRSYRPDGPHDHKLVICLRAWRSENADIVRLFNDALQRTCKVPYFANTYFVRIAGKSVALDVNSKAYLYFSDMRANILLYNPSDQSSIDSLVNQVQAAAPMKYPVTFFVGIPTNRARCMSLSEIRLFLTRNTCGGIPFVIELSVPIDRNNYNNNNNRGGPSSNITPVLVIQLVLIRLMNLLTNADLPRSPVTATTPPSSETQSVTQSPSRQTASRSTHCVLQ